MLPMIRRCRRGMLAAGGYRSKPRPLKRCVENAWAAERILVKYIVPCEDATIALYVPDVGLLRDSRYCGEATMGGIGHSSRSAIPRSSSASRTRTIPSAATHAAQESTSSRRQRAEDCRSWPRAASSCWKLQADAGKSVGRTCCKSLQATTNAFSTSAEL